MGCAPCSTNKVLSLFGVSGNGLIEYSNGDVYDGEWIGNYVFQGHGILYQFRRGTYEGQFHEGKVHGKGTVQFENGDRYQGGFMDNHFHGKGTYTLANGNVYQGSFDRGRKVGRFRVHKQDWDGICDFDTGYFNSTYSEDRVNQFSPTFISHQLYRSLYIGDLKVIDSYAKGKFIKQNEIYSGGFLKYSKNGYGETVTLRFKHKGYYLSSIYSGNGLYTCQNETCLGLLNQNSIVQGIKTQENRWLCIFTIFQGQPMYKILIRSGFIQRSFFEGLNNIGSQYERTKEYIMVGQFDQGILKLGTKLSISNELEIVEFLDREQSYGFTILKDRQYYGNIANRLKIISGTVKMQNHIYSGDWQNNLYHGNGTCQYQDGSTYCGAWKLGRRHGVGTFINFNGDIQEGQWIEDQKQQ